MAQLFIGAPLTAYLDEEKRFDPEARKLIESIIRRATGNGWTVYSAHEAEQWGLQILDAGQTLKRDLDAIERSDIVLFLLLDAPSPGVNLEIGYAIRAAKEILFLGSDLGGVGYLGLGLVEAGRALQLPDESDLWPVLASRIEEYRHG